MDDIKNFWALSPPELFSRLRTTEHGLSQEDAKNRHSGEKQDHRSPFWRDVLLFLSQFKSPLVLLLVLSLILSSVLGEIGNSIIIFAILFLTGVLGFFQERNAGRAVEELHRLVQVKATVLRNGERIDVETGDVVPGDIVLLDAGDVIPGDALILRSKDLFVNESVLTGESFPAEKNAGTAAEDAPLAARKNSVFRGTSVVSGTAEVLIAAVGKDTELGRIEKEMGASATETAFEKGIRRFGYLLMQVSLVLAAGILGFNLIVGRPAAESFLFALVLSVGLTPELLPSIITITLSAGARRLAAKKVIVKKLASIQNLGAIDVLCSDKTGTLTEGEVKIHSQVCPDGTTREKIGLYALLNAKFESGFTNPLDEAIRKNVKADIAGYTKFDEVPYDFIRKRLSVVVSLGQQHLMITKGALRNIMEVCTKAELNDGSVVMLDDDYRRRIDGLFSRYSSEGFRAIGICYRNVTGAPVINKDDEQDMIFLGMILLHDPLKEDILGTIAEMKAKGVLLKLITGDNALIAHHVAQKLEINSPKVVTGQELYKMTDESLVAMVNEVDIFAETEPSQKERIVLALQKAGHTVGYLGDGINDASAIRAADVGITVNNAVDVAKEAADMVLLEKKLEVLCEGITEGRKTYLNTLKYIFLTTSANFGNMFSMAIVSVFLPFLPLLPVQVLLLNFLTDLPSMAIASDSVDEEALSRPGKWNMKMIRNFMIVFGLESSLFDFLTFGMLYFIFHASPELFRTGWFVESALTEVLILMIIRTRRPFIRSRPGKLLAIASALVLLIVITLPYVTGEASLFQFVPLPFTVILAMLVITLLYALLGELTKQMLFRRIHF